MQQLSSFFHKQKALPKYINVVSTNYGDPTLIEKKTKLGCPPRSHVIGWEIYTMVASMVEGIYVQAFRKIESWGRITVLLDARNEV